MIKIRVFHSFIFSAAIYLVLGACNFSPDEVLVPHPLEPYVSQKVFIIGASTVRYDNDLPGDIGANHSQYSTRVGWGTELCQYLLKPENVSNQARRGATAESYQIPTPDKGPAYWAQTRQMIEDSVSSAGGFLLIQFGGNDNIQGVAEEVFKTQMRFYRDQAFLLNLTPVFITPVESRTTDASGTRGEFPRYIREVAAEDSGVLLLDLHAESLAYFLEQSTRNLGFEFGNVPYIWLGSGSFNRIDNTHFEERGALIVARWVRKLACELGDKDLCRLFGGEPPAIPVIYSHSEYIDDPGDPDLNGWYVANAQGTLDEVETERILEIVYDEERQSNVTRFLEHPDVNYFVHGDWQDDTERSWANSKQRILEWSSLLTSPDFRIYVEAETTDGHRIFTYKPLDFDEGPGQNFPQYIRFGLGANAGDGTWRFFRRDLDADLKQFEPDNDIIQVNGMRIKAVGRIDDLKMF